jgi:hypothetical protein
VEVHTAGAASLSLAARGALATTVSRIAREAKGPS